MPFDHAAIGPVELLVVAFPGSQFRGEIVPAMKELVDNGIIRILDLVFIAKERDGTVVKLELSDAGDVVALEYQELAASDDLEAFISDDDLEVRGRGARPRRLRGDPRLGGPVGDPVPGRRPQRQR